MSDRAVMSKPVPPMAAAGATAAATDGATDVPTPRTAKKNQLQLIALQEKVKMLEAQLEKVSPVAAGAGAGADGGGDGAGGGGGGGGGGGSERQTQPYMRRVCRWHRK